MATLKTYRAKRRFDITAEPRGGKTKGTGRAFVIQKHAARRLHYDLRLEIDGVMKSWAVTRGPSLVPGEKRLAVHVEDHPIEYNTFEGTIPQGQYGGGTVMIWDRGTWTADHDARKAYEKGHLDFHLEGEKLHGGWHLVRMRHREGERQDPWLLIKSDDEGARASGEGDILEEDTRSVATGRTMEQIAAGEGGAAVWNSSRSDNPTSTKAKPPAKKNVTAKPRAPAKSKTAAKSKAPAKPKASAKAKAPSKPAASKPKSRAAAKKPAAPRRSRTAAEDVRAPAVRSAPVAKELPKLAGKRAPLPDFIPPCLALLSDKAPDSSNWLHEIKFDGYRIQARIGGGKVALKTRKGLDWTERFLPIAEALEALPVTDAILDGEMVVENAEGQSSFSALQEALKNGTGGFLFYVFDLLHLDGRDVREAPLSARKDVLRGLIAALPAQGLVRFSDHFEERGSVMLQHACRLQLEGIVSKRSDAPYRSGRGGEWLKSKCSERQEFVVIGFADSTVDARALGALILGYYEDGELQYAGRVGTGYTVDSARAIWKQLQPLRQDSVPLERVPAEERGRKPRWVRPQLVAEIDFRGWTHGMRLRHPSFKGLREDKDASEIVRESKAMPAAPMSDASQKTPRRGSKAAGAAPTAKTSTDGKAAAKPAAAKAPTSLSTNIHLSHPERVYWDDVGLTKQGLAEYYAQVWPWIAPHVTGRVLSLVRCPDGAGDKCFFQKHASAGLMEKHLHMVAEDGDRVIAIDDLDGLLSLVQAGVLEIHVRGSSIDRLDAANRLVFDLDPAPEVDWAEVKKAARDVRAKLAEMGLQTFLKTTGGKGLHVVLPIENTPWEEAKAFAKSIASGMAAESPERFLAVASKAARKGRIFIDYLRNSREATAICAYSTRARPGATVSVPITWEELGALQVPNRYTVANVLGRLKKLKADPWADIDKVRQKLPAKGRK